MLLTLQLLNLLEDVPIIRSADSYLYGAPHDFRLISSSVDVSVVCGSLDARLISAMPSYLSTVTGSPPKSSNVNALSPASAAIRGVVNNRSTVVCTVVADEDLDGMESDRDINGFWHKAEVEGYEV